MNIQSPQAWALFSVYRRGLGLVKLKFLGLRLVTLKYLGVGSLRQV